MTELAIAQVAKGLAGASLSMMPVVAAIDISTQTALVGLASLGITSLTAIALAWIGLKQNELRKKQDAMAITVEEVKKQSDGITSALVTSESKASRMEGIAEGKQIATADAALVAKGKLEGAAVQKAADEK